MRCVCPAGLAARRRPMALMWKVLLPVLGICLAHYMYSARDAFTPGE